MRGPAVEDRRPQGREEGKTDRYCQELFLNFSSGAVIQIVLDCNLCPEEVQGFFQMVVFGPYSALEGQFRKLLSLPRPLIEVSYLYRETPIPLPPKQAGNPEGSTQRQKHASQRPAQMPLPP